MTDERQIELVLFIQLAGRLKRTVRTGWIVPECHHGSEVAACRHAERRDAIRVNAELCRVGANVAQGALHILDLRGPRPARSAGKAVVDRDDHVPERAELFGKLPSPRLVATSPRAAVNDEDGGAPGSHAVRRRFVQVERAVMADRRIVAP